MKRIELAREIARMETTKLNLRKESENARVKLMMRGDWNIPAMRKPEMIERYECLKGGN